MLQATAWIRVLERTKIAANTTVGVRCDGRKPWKVYVPIQITVFRNVFVTVKPVPRDSAIGADDVRLERRNVAGRHYVTNLERLSHQRLRRDLAPGTVLTPQMFQANHLVRTGQRVTIFKKINGLNIRMAGIALQDGYRDQRIRIRNVSSNKELEGIVRTPQMVEILL